MTRFTKCSVGLVLGVVCILVTTNSLSEAGDRSANDVFVGSTPCTVPIRPLLRIADDTNVDWIQWRLAVHCDNAKAPTVYELECDARAGQGQTVKTFQKQGRWTIVKRKQADSNVEVYKLDMGLALLKVGSILHILNADQSLMVGTAGWSYTLNRAAMAEKPGDLSVALARPSDSYRLSPLASGPEVFGIFEGRTPGQGIARVLEMPEDRGCLKVKWRVTLFQDSKTLAPTTYKIENSFLRDRAREGQWSIIRGTTFDPNGTIYRLEATKTEPALQLLKGDDNVLFFLDEVGKPLVGHVDFSYTLNRKKNVDAR